MFKTTVAGLLAHKLRLALTAVAIVLGVSLVSGTFVLSDTLNSTFDGIFANANAGVSVRIQGPVLAGAEAQSFDASQRDTLPASVVTTVSNVPGVRVAEGYAQGVAAIIGRNGKAIVTQAPAFGINWTTDAKLSPYHLRAGTAPQGPDQVVIDVTTAGKQGFHVGDIIRVAPANGQAQPFTLVGLTGFGGQDNLAGATVAAWETPTAQHLLQLEGKFTSVSVAGNGTVPDAELATRIAAVLPRTDVVQTAADAQAKESAQVQQTLSFFSDFLLAFGVIALFVGSFIIVNTFSILVAQRTRELALLRCLGATRRQVRLMVLVEALVIGVIAAALGAALGVLVAKGLFALFNSGGSSLPADTLVVTPRTIIVSLIVGVVITVLAAVLPARRATRIAPIAALREFDPSLQSVGRRRSVVGVMVTAVGLLFLLLGLFGSGGNRLLETGVGTFLMFLGIAVVAPVLVRPVAGLIGLPLERLRGVPGKLARENSVRSPRRTASSAAALMIGVGFVALFAVVIASAKGTVSSALDKGDRAAYLITGANNTLISPDVAAALRKDPKLVDVTELRAGNFVRDGSRESLQAIDTAHLDQVVGFDLVSGAVDLSSGSVLVSDTASTAHGFALGSTVQMQFPYTTTVPHRVTGIYRSNPLLGDFSINLTEFAKNYPPQAQLDVVILANPAPGVDHSAGLDAMTADVNSFPTVTAQDQAAYKDAQASQLDALLGLLVALLALAIIIATLGIVNTLALSIVERYREIGLLRALGMTRRQTRSMIRWESVIIALLGAILGVVVGVFLGWAFVRALKDQGFDTFVIPWSSLVEYFLAAGFFGVVAAIFPALRASRLNVLEAIASE